MKDITIYFTVVTSICLVVLLTSRYKLNAFISLFLVSLFLALCVLPENKVINELENGFGNTMGSTGFVVILGAIIGVILDKTGAALTLARYLLQKTGQSRAPIALGLTGFLTGLSIFCDSGFIILSGLAKSFSSKTRIGMPLIAISLACGLYSVHCLIPTHPGSLAAAGILSVNLGDLVLMGILFAIPGFAAAFLWIRKMTKSDTYPPAAAHELPLQELENGNPGVLKSLLPIAVPIILIGMGSLLSTAWPHTQKIILQIMIFAGQPVIALCVGTAFSFLLLHRHNLSSINHIFETAIEKAGPILIVTAAGGMFGAIIKETGIGSSVGSALKGTGLGIVIPFVIAFILKTAQGSSTVAIITTASIIAPMLPALGLASQTGKLFTMLAMGAGSMMISLANDSYFWVITKFSDLQAQTTLKIFSSATIIMGLTVFALVWLASTFFLH